MLAHVINKEDWYGSVLTLVVSYNLVTNRVVSKKERKKNSKINRPTQHVNVLKGEKAGTQGS